MSQVLGLDYLLEDVLVRVDSVKSILRCGVVSKAWASAALREEILVKFTAERSPPLLGIVVEYGVWGHDMRYVEFTPMPVMDSGVRAHAWEVEAAFVGDFSLDIVLFSGYSEVVLREKMAPRGYAKRSILEPITTTRHLLPCDDFFQEAPASICACFVVIDGVKAFFDGCPQVHDGLYIHPGAYCLRVYGVLYMMYVVGVLFSCELTSGAFGIVDLPESFSTAMDMDYMIARSGKSELCIVRLLGASMQQWSCDMASQDKNWILRSTYNLRRLFDCHIPASFWETKGCGGESSAGEAVSYNMKIRAVGENFAYAIITFDFCPWINLLDTEKRQVVNSSTHSTQCRWLSVTTVYMPWPKTFPRV
ncbi:hypothetical protein VPH35_018784 [Triticum aestivum]